MLRFANGLSAIRFILFVAPGAPFDQSSARAEKKHQPDKVARKAEKVRG
jgi:hypothetical protein